MTLEFVDRYVPDMMTTQPVSIADDDEDGEGDSKDEGEDNESIVESRRSGNEQTAV